MEMTILGALAAAHAALLATTFRRALRSNEPIVLRRPPCGLYAAWGGTVLLTAWLTVLVVARLGGH